MKISFDVGNIRSAPIEKIDMYIEIVGSSNPKLNAMAQKSRLTIQAALSQKYTKVAITIVDDVAGLKRLVAKKPDLVVLGMKFLLVDPTKSYDESPKLWLSSYLRQNNIEFTGSDTHSLTLEFDKQTAKKKVLDAGLRSSAYFISKMNQPVFTHTLRFPVFVKPTNRGGSKGIDEKSVVHSNTELKSKILSIHNEYSSDALIEEYLPGREFSVAVMRKPHSDDLFTMPIEITAPVDNNGNSFLSKAVKDADTEKVLEIHDEKLKNDLSILAIGVFTALESRDYGRIDIRLDRNGLPSFIEANLMPGLSNHGYLSRCFYANEHINYSDMIQSIISLGLERIIRSPLILDRTLPSYSDETTVGLVANSELVI